MFQGFWRVPVDGTDLINDDMFQRVTYARANELNIDIKTYKDYVNLLYRLQGIYQEVKNKEDNNEEKIMFHYHMEQLFGKRYVNHAYALLNNLI